MSLTLVTPPGNFRAFKALIAAEYNSIEVAVAEYKDNKSAEFLAQSPLGRVPVLQTPQGSIFESNAIARYVAKMRRDTELCGATLFQAGQVDSWIDFCAHEIELAATVWYYPVIGYMPYVAAAVTKAQEDLKKALGALEKHLLDKTYLVGESVTLADITVVSALVYPMKLVMDADYRKAFPCVTRWFTTCVNQPQFQAVVGKVELCKTEMTAAGAPAAAPAKKEKKKKDAPPPPPPQEKKKVHPLALLDKEKPSAFIGDAWKKIYSNATNYDDAMATFWERFDSEGWSLWECKYKYNKENTQVFMTSNLVGGFVQRSGEIRKWAFGVMQITGDESKKDIRVSGIWLLRGNSPEHLIECNDDANWYEWTEIKAPVSDSDKKKVQEMWCSETEVEGQPVLDCKVFK